MTVASCSVQEGGAVWITGSQYRFTRVRKCRDSLFPTAAFDGPAARPKLQIFSSTDATNSRSAHLLAVETVALDALTRGEVNSMKKVSMNMYVMRCAILISASFAFLACSSRNDSSDVSTSPIALSADDRADDGYGPGGADNEGDDDEGFLDARVEQGFAIAPVPLATEGKTRLELNRIGYGSYLVNAISACRDCHSTEGHFSGGRVFNNGPRGVVYARNLTPDPATGLQLTESQFIEALRTGRDFRPGATQQLAVMIWPDLRWMARGDLKAIYAYLRAIPPVVHQIPPDTRVGYPPPVPFPQVYNAGDVVRPLPRETDQIQPNVNRGLAISALANPRDLDDERHRYGRGSYLVTAIGTCTGCHTNPPANPITLRLSTATFLSGGRIFTPPPPIQSALHEARAFSADLTGQTHGFFHEPDSTFERYRTIIDTGTHADETPPRPIAFPMPWDLHRNMVDEDLRSVFTYISLLPARTGAADKPIQDYTRWCATRADCQSGETCYSNPATGTNECVGGACESDQDCSTCQTCTSGTCTAPGVGNACLASGI